MQTPIETLDMDVRMYNQIKRERIDTVEQLLGRMYQPEGIKHFSTRFQHNIERVLKQKGLLAYTRGEYAQPEDVYDTPLTWEQLHAMVGKLVAVEIFSAPGVPSRYRVCWVYDFNAEDDRVSIQYGNEYVTASPISNFYALKDFPLPENAGKAAPTLAETAGAAPEIQEVEIVPQEAAPLAGTPAAEALALHSRILANISVMAQSLTQMCRDLREMRDSQLYRQMGYSSFEAYTEKEIGIKRRQAYTYVQIAERLPEDFIEQSAQLGVQKLALLASATEEQRELIIRDTDISETTVRELKEKLRGLKIQPAKAEPEQEQLPGQMTFVPEDSTGTNTETDTGTDTETDTGTDIETDTDTQTAQKQPFHAEKSVESVDFVEEAFRHYFQKVESALDDMFIFIDNAGGKCTRDMQHKLWKLLIDYAGSLES